MQIKPIMNKFILYIVAPAFTCTTMHISFCYKKGYLNIKYCDCMGLKLSRRNHNNFKSFFFVFSGIL